MTEARQIIPDLETSKKYLIKAEVIDKNLGVAVGQSVAVIETPADSTIPDAIDSTTPGAFLLFSNSKSVMFRFNAPLANDIAGYDYEVYATNSLSGTLLASGESYTTVFTVILSGSETTPSDLEGSPKVFYGRVRAFDTTGNEGPWTPLIASQSTLVDSAEITSLTASKIKAGTITSSIINLDGANSVIRSTNYVSGTDGWAIRGDGTAEFSAGVIRGTVKAGSVFIDANNRWKSDATGATITVPEFKVGSSSQYVSWDGTNLSISTTGNVSIGSGSNSLVWNGSTLNISGNVVITGGSTLNSITNAQNTADTANTAANNAQITANNALPSSSFNRSAIVSQLNSIYGGGNTTINGAMITTGTISANAVVADFISAFSINANNINAGTLTGREINNGNGTFLVTQTGQLTASSANITGTITATAGAIGNWSIINGSLYGSSYRWR